MPPITARPGRRRDARLDAEQKAAARLLDDAAVAVHWTALDGTILWANRMELELLGYSPDEYIGRRVEEFAADPARLDEASRRLARGERLSGFPMPMRAKDGSVKELLIDSSVVRHGGRFAHTQCFSREAGPAAAERALARRLREREGELELNRAEFAEFASLASHDLHSPLRKILIFTDRLRKRAAERLDEETRGYLDRIQRSADRMERLIDDLLSLSRVTTAAVRFEDLDPGALAAEALRELEPRIREAGARVELSPLPPARGDRHQLKVLFKHLLDNALKFRRPDVDCRILITGRREGDWVELRVDDNGIGFDAKYAELIFKPFQRLHGPQAFPGSGLGLSLCRRIAARLNGSIHAEPRPDTGAIFVVRLPGPIGRGGAAGA